LELIAQSVPVNVPPAAGDVPRQHPTLMKPKLPTSQDALLFTPGPLTTSLAVKQAMLHDAGSWHWEFNALVAEVRQAILALGGVSRESGWEAILMQGSGTFGVEAVFQSAIPPEGKVAVLSNGAYGERMILMLQHARIAHTILRTAEDTPPTPEALDALLASDPAITHVAAVHCEKLQPAMHPMCSQPSTAPSTISWVRLALVMLGLWRAARRMASVAAAILVCE
jgi:hypothetical protein